MAELGRYKKEAVAVTDAVSEVAHINVAKYKRLSMQIVNTGENPLVTFSIRRKNHTDTDCPEEVIYHLEESFTSPGGMLVDCSGALNSLAASGVGSFDLDVTGIESIYLYASCDTAAPSTLSFFGGLQ